MRDHTRKHTREHSHHEQANYGEGHHPHNRHRGEHGPHGSGEHHRHDGQHQHHERPGHDEHHGRGGGQGRAEHGGGRFGGPRGRARRGEARFILLDALRDGPKHGYEIIKALEERSGGQYAPSPGTVYPTMQYLEDMGLVRADQENERRVFHLTDAGRADLEAHAQDIADFWARFAETVTTPAAQAEIGFLREDLDALVRSVWDGLRGTFSAGEVETVRQVRSALTRCRGEVCEIIAGIGGSE